MARASGKLPGVVTINGSDSAWFSFYVNQAIIPMKNMMTAVGDDTSDFVDTC